MLYKAYSLESLLIEWVLWGWTERNEENLFSLSLPTPLMERLFASLVYLTTSWEDHYYPQCWAGAEVEPLWGSLCQESVPDACHCASKASPGQGSLIHRSNSNGCISVLIYSWNTWILLWKDVNLHWVLTLRHYINEELEERVNKKADYDYYHLGEIIFKFIFIVIKKLSEV